MVYMYHLVLWEDLEGAGGEGGGRGDRDGEDMWTQGLFISMYDRIHYKKKKTKKKNKIDDRHRPTNNPYIRVSKNNFKKTMIYIIK